MAIAPVEVTAMKVRREDPDLEEAWFRITDLESEPVDDETWDSMRALADEALGGIAERVEAERGEGSVKAWSGPTLIDVLWHGQAINIYYTAGITCDDPFYEMLTRLRSNNFAIVQGAADGDGWAEVPPSRAVAEMAAAHRAAQGG